CGAAIRPIAFDVRRLSPTAALGRLASPRNFARGALAIAKVAVAGALFARATARALGASGREGIPAWESWWREAAALGIRASAALVALGLVEYALERWWLERDLRMTRAEREEEAARLEGKREHKSRRRKDRQRILEGSRRSLEAIPGVER
ncbi:MAG: EscU/YscU/HrcU family type III secretion system export apparatus switch protein, partial [Planctomycetota bacterium]